MASRSDFQDFSCSVDVVVDDQRAASDDDEVPFPSRCIRRTGVRRAAVRQSAGQSAVAAMTSTTATTRNFTASLKYKLATPFSTSLPPAGVASMVVV